MLSSITVSPPAASYSFQCQGRTLVIEAFTRACLQSFLPFFWFPSVPDQSQRVLSIPCPPPLLLSALCVFDYCPLALLPAQSSSHSFSGTSLILKPNFFFFLMRNVPWTSDEATSATLPWVPKRRLILMLFLSSLDVKGRDSSNFHWLHCIFTRPDIF